MDCYTILATHRVTKNARMYHREAYQNEITHKNDLLRVLTCYQIEHHTVSAVQMLQKTEIYQGVQNRRDDY